MRHLSIFEEYNDEEEFEVVPEQVLYIKKRCKQHLPILMQMLDKLDHDFAYIPSVKNQKRNEMDIANILKNSEGIADSAGLTALWFADSYYLYVMPVEVADEHEFATLPGADNELRVDIDKEECIVLVMV